MTRTEKIQKYIEDHRKVFDILGIKNPYYKPSMFYSAVINKRSVLVSRFFDNELERYDNSDPYIYVESTDGNSDLIQTDERILYRYHVTKAKTDEAFVSNGPRGKAYLIPVEEFEIVAINQKIVKELIPKTTATKIKTARKPVEEVVEEEEDDLLIPDPNTDLPMSSMTMRDYAAIKLSVPLSHKAWLNEMIKQANK